MKMYSINEAAKLTGIPRSRVQQAILTCSIESHIETLPSLKTRYVISKEQLDKLVGIFSREPPMRETFPIRGSGAKKSLESQADVISARIRRKLEVLREERELELEISGYSS